MRPTHCIARTVLWLALGSLATAQSWSVTGYVPTPGTCTAGVFLGPTTSATLPVGPVTPGSLFGCNYGSIGAFASWATSVPAQVAPLAFGVTTSASAPNSSSSSGAGASVSFQLDLTLQAPSPVGGRLVVRFNDAGGPALHGSVTLDLDADGIVEFSGSGNSAGTELPVFLPAGGRVVRITMHGGASAFLVPYPAYGQSWVEAQFFPGQPAITPLTTGPWSLLVYHPIGDSVILTVPFAGQAWLAFGFAPTQVPLLPNVTQLVTLDYVFATNTMTLNLPALPSGTALYCQGLAATASGLFSTNSVRALWP